ncbi:hypothetical protein Sru01_28200 [Sphaerisporangium rufum]|uniref:Uncharacterized protein n=1 Tax=Sphaerisporangium rufum TaxID=1381558 RepID=A0A919R1Y0_9ACTN|nr:hypothetical protein Sru01_28200 [Sphaerisporangium rufum]
MEMPAASAIRASEVPAWPYRATTSMVTPISCARRARSVMVSGRVARARAGVESGGTRPPYRSAEIHLLTEWLDFLPFGQ